MRKLPSLTSLRAFEAAARHLSFKLAATELGVTATAISHQIRHLEQSIGQGLFIRRVRSIELTAAGQDLATVIEPAFDAIAVAISRVTEKHRRQSVTIGAGPIFSARWLVPRLGQFWQNYPTIDLKVHHSPLPVDQQLSRYDLAVAWGDGTWSGDCVELLVRIEVTPIFSGHSEFNQRPLIMPEELLELPLLHHRNDKGWQQWFNAAGVELSQELPGMCFDDANVLLQAALAGQGIALGIPIFIQEELSSGRLRQPFDVLADPGNAYYLIFSDESLHKKSAQCVHDWLLDSR